MNASSNHGRVLTLAAVLMLAACGTSHPKTDVDVSGDADVDQTDDDAQEADIPGETFCIPGLVSCADSVTYRTCLPDGSGWGDLEACDTSIGQRCYEGSGCYTPCDEAATSLTSMGCLFYAVDLDQTDGLMWDSDQKVYAIVVANVDDTFAATVTFEQKVAGAWQVMETDNIDPNGLYTYRLPADRHIEDTGQADDKVVRVSSNLPIIAYQFNPIDSADNASNDASLLLPVATLGPYYWIPTYYSFQGPGHFADVAIVGTADGTQVTVTPAVNTRAGGDIPAMTARTSQAFSINEGTLLQIATEGYAADLTGTLVWADAPVAVFAGTECSDIPFNCAWCLDSYGTTPGYPPAPAEWNCDSPDMGCPAHVENTCAWCDHIEEQIFPLTTWGKRYVASRVPVRAEEGVEAALWRVLASEPNTTVTITTPPGAVLRVPPGTVGPPYVLNEGEYLEFELAGTHASPGDAIVEADMPILLVQFIEGQECTDQPDRAGGDPAMVQMVPVEQYMDEYIFLTPNTYDVDYLVVTRQAGVEVLLDGVPLSATPFRSAGEGYEVASFQVADGVHHVSSASPFGIVVVGYSPYVSYAYVGGMDLEVINPII
jgi:hypothetical protein